MTNKMIDKKQIQLIHVAKSKLGMDDEIYRELLARYKVSSSKKLTYRQATMVIDELKKKGFKLKKSKNRPRTEKGTQISRYQLDLIQFLASQYPWKYEDGFQLWLKKQDKLAKISLYEGNLYWANDGQYVTEKLKQMTGITNSDISKCDIQVYQEWQKENPSKSFKDWKQSHAEKREKKDV